MKRKNRAIELGFADDLLIDEKKSGDTPAYSYSSKAVANALLNKLTVKAEAEAPPAFEPEPVPEPEPEETPAPETEPEPTPKGRSVNELMERLNLFLEYHNDVIFLP